MRFPTSRLCWLSHIRNLRPQTRLFTADAKEHDTLSVPPTIPTALQGQAQLDLVDGNDLLLQFAPSSLHVLPGPIDVPRFQDALAKTLALFPTAAGRLKRTGDDWRIDLTNSAVPVSLASCASPHVLPAAHARFVVQPSAHVAPYVSPVDLLGALQGGDAPLVSFKLTTMQDGRTVVGNSWNHVLGDGATLTRFVHTLSAFYSSTPPPAPPTFHKRRTSVTLDIPALVPRYTPHVQQSYPLEDVLARYGREARETAMLDIEFSPEELTALWAHAKRSHDGARITRQDALTAYLVTLHNRCLDAPIDTVMNLMDVRLRYAPTNPAELYRDPAVAGSLTAIAHARVPHSSLSAIARAIRTTTHAARTDPAWVATYLRVNGAQYVRGTREGRFYMYPPPGAVLVNSLMGVDRNKLASFGFAGRTQFYTDTSWERMFRVHPANPVCLSFRSSTTKVPEIWEPNAGHFVAAFRVAHHLKERMLAMKERDMQCLLKSRDLPLGGQDGGELPLEIREYGRSPPRSGMGSTQAQL